MFYDCSKLTSLDLSSFDTSDVTDANYLFSGCSSLVSLDGLSNWNTSRLVTANYLFQYCSSLVSLNLSNWNTSNVIQTSSLFEGCTSLETLDLSNFDMSSMKRDDYCKNMFNNCPKLSTIKCKQAFKDWCVSKNSNIGLTNYATINWEIVG